MRISSSSLGVQNEAASRVCHPFDDVLAPIPGHALIVGEVVRVLGHHIDPLSFYSRLAMAVRAVEAHSLDAVSFRFDEAVITVAPDPDAPGCLRVLIDSGEGPRPFDQRARAAAREITEMAFDAQADAVRSLAIRAGVTPAAFLSLPHLFVVNAARFHARLRDPVDGTVLAWNDMVSCLCDKAELALAHGAGESFFAFPPPGETTPRARAQLAVPVHGLGAGTSRELFLVVRIGQDPLNGALQLQVPTVLTPGMVARNRAMLGHIRWFWRISDGRAAA